MIYLIGIGLIPEQITYAGLLACKKSDKVYLETYTSKFPENTISDLEGLIGKKITAIGRDEM
ncbi:MAG: diphthine synthase, partial [Candidatus Diapherotrites archaeon]|nr:diphthine synthase [Candidatus Diapherotrites archaeon]